jgi:hypothetical protein
MTQHARYSRPRKPQSEQLQLETAAGVQSVRHIFRSQVSVRRTPNAFGAKTRLQSQQTGNGCGCGSGIGMQTPPVPPHQCVLWHLRGYWGRVSIITSPAAYAQVTLGWYAIRNWGRSCIIKMHYYRGARWLWAIFCIPVARQAVAAPSLELLEFALFTMECRFAHESMGSI